jgi:hypothetical protein
MVGDTGLEPVPRLCDALHTLALQGGRGGVLWHSVCKKGGLDKVGHLIVGDSHSSAASFALNRCKWIWYYLEITILHNKGRRNGILNP